MDTDTFKYQENITIQKYTKVLESDNENATMGFSRFITSPEWDNYINDPFDTIERQNYLQHVSALRDLKKDKAKKLYPPYGLTFASFTTNVGVVDIKEKQRKIDAGHLSTISVQHCKKGISTNTLESLKKRI
jgi:hypothetical protein